MKYHAYAILVFATAIGCLATASPQSNLSVSGRFVLDTLYARILVPKDGRCEPPCAQTDLFLKYKFEERPGTIDTYEFGILQGGGWGQAWDYTDPKRPGIWYTDSIGTFVKNSYDEIDTVHVLVGLRGSFWDHSSHYGGFAISDTLAVPVERQ